MIIVSCIIKCVTEPQIKSMIRQLEMTDQIYSCIRFMIMLV